MADDAPLPWEQQPHPYLSPDTRAAWLAAPLPPATPVEYKPGWEFRG